MMHDNLMSFMLWNDICIYAKWSWTRNKSLAIKPSTSHKFHMLIFNDSESYRNVMSNPIINDKGSFDRRLTLLMPNEKSI